MTEAENKLWNELRRRKIHGLRFFRQYSIGPYILDFYCPTVRLSIELDGDYHLQESQNICDHDRTLYIQSHDIHELRFWNYEVISNLSHVISKIVNAVKRHPPLK